jgi:DUF4097 and DUF4098 domain-containing protein YvlB
MKNSTKIWLVTATILMIAGLLLFAVAMQRCGLDFMKLDTQNFQTNTYEITESFSDFSIQVNTADVIFALSEDETCKIECFEEEKAKHSVSVEKNTLVIQENNQKRWYDHVSFSFKKPKITVFLPKLHYASLTVNGSTGDITIPKDFAFKDVTLLSNTGDITFSAQGNAVKMEASTGNLSIKNTSVETLSLSVSTGIITVDQVVSKGDITVMVSTGDTVLTNTKCRSLISKGNTGSLSLQQVIATEKFSFERTTGDVTFDRSDAKEIFVQTDTGNIKGTLLSNKIFVAQSDTGKIDVPKSTQGGLCGIKTDTGNINLNID